MFSEVLREALAREVVGQPHAIHSVVRGMTRLMSGLTPRERSWCAYLFIGPPGTGRAHLVRTVARGLHGDEQSVLTVNCNMGGNTDPWRTFVDQLAPLFVDSSGPSMFDGGEIGNGATAGRTSPPRIVLVQDLERASKDLYPFLARMLETGQVMLPDGRRGRIENCLFFLTSGLCSREILDESSRIGFAGSSQEEDGDTEQDAIVKLCREEAEALFGIDLLARLDNMVVFRRLEEDHLASVLERHFARMNRWLVRHDFQCELLPAAKAFLLERGTRHTSLGAQDLILAHRRQVEFPVADLMVSQRIPPGGRVLVDHEPDQAHLHFTVTQPEETSEAPTAYGAVREIPVA